LARVTATYARRSSASSCCSDSAALYAPIGGVAGLGQLRDRPGVAPQVGGQHGGVGHPVVGDPVAGEGALHQGGQEHRLPLQALGLVHREQLDRLAVRRAPPGRGRRPARARPAGSPAAR
jgi:hypothetical protein